ncbi:MAG: anaerobic sulfatase maturase [Desulfobacterales bacterium]|nr:anaerobic sulfatase maturase [Desulfobacterales bacterium]
MNLLVKPASYLCNLDCSYCFYKRTEALYPGSRPMMTKATAETMIQKALALGHPNNSFCWQGGEPTLMGLDFFRKVIDLQQRLAADGQSVETSIQTNGLLIDDDWAGFLADNNILVGLSLDGPPDIHDRHRIDRQGRGSFAAVMNAAENMSRRGVAFNILTLLTPDNVYRPADLYSFFLKQGFTHLQFIPCADVDPATGRPAERAVTGEALGRFYIRLFDLWLENGFPHVSIRLFEDLLLFLMDGVRASCQWLPACDSYLVVEHNGDVYPCDFYVDAPHRLGNIHRQNFESLMNSPERRAFAEAKADWPEECRRCRFADFCQADCPRHRIDGTSLFCRAWKMLFAHIESHPVDIRARALEARRKHQEAMWANVGRNDPCPCGSGKKYKHCCMV